MEKAWLKRHGYNVSAYLRKSVNSVGVVKSMCTMYVARLEYHTVTIKIDYTYTEKYPDPNVVTMAYTVYSTYYKPMMYYKPTHLFSSKFLYR